MSAPSPRPFLTYLGLVLAANACVQFDYDHKKAPSGGRSGSSTAAGGRTSSSSSTGAGTSSEGGASIGIAVAGHAGVNGTQNAASLAGSSSGMTTAGAGGIAGDLNCPLPPPELPSASAGGDAMASLALTPPMGWNSWNKFGGNINEQLIKEIADAMVASGMAAVGYEYINIDDTWQISRDDCGNILPDPIRFPTGMKALADYVHAHGLKLGLYSDRGTQTCAGRPGSYGYEVRDAATYASWGIDYLKYDNCHTLPERDAENGREDFTKMGEALRATGRPIVYSICAWWFHSWMPKVGHLWRTTTDIEDNFDANYHGVVSLINKNGEHTGRFGSFTTSTATSAAYGPPGLAGYAGPGHWNDPDMLEVGNGGMTDIEYRTHFSMWAMMAAPLIAGNDLRLMDRQTREILLNEDVIAVDQDPLGVQGTPIEGTSLTLEVWSKRLAGTDTFAVALFNRTEAAADISVAWSELGIASDSATVRDLWAHADLGRISGQYTANVPSHGVVMLKVVGDSP